MRKLEERLVADDGSPIEEWGPAFEQPRDSQYWDAAEWRRYVTSRNREAKVTGHSLRYRSVEVEE